MSALQTITLHGHFTGPNPWKVIIFLYEFGIPFEHIKYDMVDLKKPAYEAINPNGRVPAIQDPNTGLTIFESGAIIDYLIETYDKQGLFKLDTEQQKWSARGWRDFQMSGQGPYFGQAFWFQKYHPEKVQSAVDRYVNEAIRVTKVIDSHLKAQGTNYLVGDKVSYADLMFFPWFFAFDDIKPKGYDRAKEFPVFQAWVDRITARDSVSRMYREKRESTEAELKKRAEKANV